MNEYKNLTLGSLFDGSGGFPLGGLISGITPVWASEIEPFPIRVTTKRFPFMKHYGDISRMDGGKIEPVDIITFGSPCFPEGTLVLTEYGYLPIEEVEVGMLVLTHQGRWKKVTAVGSKFGETVILRGNHYGLECTPNHPIYTTGEKKHYPKRGNGKRGNEILLTEEKAWVQAGEMEGHLWAVPNRADALPIASPIYSGSWRQKTMPPLSEELFYFIGRWLGDGWVRKGQRYGRPEGQTHGTIILCDSHDKEEELRTIVGKLTDHYSVERCRTSVKFKFTSQVLCEWLTDNFGQYAHGKTMPGWVFGLPSNYRQALLNGIADSDGYRLADNVLKISTVSKKLAESIRLLGEMQGYSTTVHFNRTKDYGVIEERTVKQRDCYTVVLTNGKKRHHLSDDRHGWYRVRSVIPTNRTTIVYNLTVADDNSYIADGIVVHNCQDMSVAGKREGLSGGRSCLFYEAIRIIKEMRCATNGKYPRWICWENVPGAFSSNRGQDFKAVLDSILSIVEEDAQVPFPDKGWPQSDLYMGEQWSIAYRVLDAQYWGVPQRRKRIYLVGDLAGQCAGEVLFKSEGLSGYSAESFRAWQGATRSAEKGAGASGLCVDGYNSTVAPVAATLGVNCGMSTGRNGVVLNDQGGSRMDITQDVTCTLRAEAHHPPVVMDEPPISLENHPTDGRVRISDATTVQTLTSRMGTGGNNVPLVMKIRCGCAGGGKGALIQTNKSATLSCNNDQTLFEPKAFGISSKESNGMKSANPHVGFYEADTAKTLDGNGGNPGCNQGGIAVVGSYAIQGSMIGRSPQNGPQDDGINEDVSFTLNTVDRHAVYTMTTGSFTQVAEDKAPTVLARDYKDPTAVCYGIGRDAFNQGKNAKFNPTFTAELQPTLVAKGPGAIQSGYTVRRLTPTECARLQGFPDWWCDDLVIAEPTEADITFWSEVWETYRKIVNPSVKPKTRNQIVRWLRDPHSDAAEYKMWGNGVALPCVCFVLSGIVYCTQKDGR